MDLVIILAVSLVLCLMNHEEAPDPEMDCYDYTVMDRETKLNETFYDDPTAFRRMVDELGFH